MKRVRGDTEPLALVAGFEPATHGFGDRCSTAELYQYELDRSDPVWLMSLTGPPVTLACSCQPAFAAYCRRVRAERTAGPCCCAIVRSCLLYTVYFTSFLSRCPADFRWLSGQCLLAASPGLPLPSICASHRGPRVSLGWRVSVQNRGASYPDGSLASAVTRPLPAPVADDTDFTTFLRSCPACLLRLAVPARLARSPRSGAMLARMVLRLRRSPGACRSWLTR
jgi:hypothetical protein